ncbi:GNAT family N-acetyltransferase [Pseudoflavonifractor sp. 60]|uniref:bifunctional histidine phosphatase family protein/GNAT family N-acetyltransferase n=1 Tax=Pseudoflavonifractor sp. 60 TaxID=2304576 RepID=UPI00136AF299|nr:bifunctional histidine phosphatase family protein/GNAT family N-acetyltransferase [Pseudoflavonifractor sp. 60]NBI65759.1 GNAT family N-acetyltransferase [Pseudoflavonifractor sp. 60]
MTTIYLVRHAEAEGNLYRLVHGWYNSLITENGYRQIAALEERFRDIPVDAVYSSDLFRTRTTARAVYRAKNLPLRTCPGLRELNLGDWEDRTFGSVRIAEPHQLDLFNRTDPAWEVEHGETFFQLGDRLYDTVRRLAERHPNQTVAMFSHGMAIRQFLGKVKNIPPEEWHTMPHGDNTAVSCLTFDGEKFEIQYEMDNSHLPEDISTLARQAWWRKDKKAAADVNLWSDIPFIHHCWDRELYLKLRREVCPGVEDSILLAEAEDLWDRSMWNLHIFHAGERPMGVILYDVRYKTKKAGYIKFLSILPEDRGRGLGVQLIGQAVSMYRNSGRDRLRLHCPRDNERARRFFQKYGFVKLREEAEGDFMEKYIGYEGW